MSACEELTEYLAAYADDELEGDLREKVRRHLDECPSCRREYDEMKKVAALYRETAVPEPTDAQWAKVTETLERCRSQPVRATKPQTRGGPARPVHPFVHGWRWWVTGALAAAAALLVIFALPTPISKPDGEPQRTALLEVESLDPDYTVEFNVPRDESDTLVITVVRVDEGAPDG